MSKSVFSVDEIKKLIEIYYEYVDEDFGLELIEPYITELNDFALNKLGKLLLGILQDYVGYETIRLNLDNSLDYEYSEKELDEYLGEETAINTTTNIAILPSRIPSPIKKRKEIVNLTKKRVKNQETLNKIIGKNTLPKEAKEFIVKLLKRLSLIGDTNV